jgi:hypothetical protein
MEITLNLRPNYTGQTGQSSMSAKGNSLLTLYPKVVLKISFPKAKIRPA